MLDTDKSNRQLVTLNKFLPFILCLWLCYEIILGDRFLGIAIAVIFIGFRIIDKLIKSKKLIALQSSEASKPFQWKFELLIIVFVAILMSLAFLIGIYFE